MEVFDTAATRRALFVLFQYYHVPLDEEEFSAWFEKERIEGWSGICQTVRRYGLVARLYSLSQAELSDRALPVPSLVRLKNGEILVLAMQEEEVRLLRGDDSGPIHLTREEFLVLWTGELMSLSPRWAWKRLWEKYHLSWFFRVMGHYKRYLWECVAAAAFFQAMGIGLPLITQVIIDKVIGNHGTSTLTVLGCAMVLFFCLQSLLSGLRTYLMNHTVNKMDAILGTELFRHLAVLPLSYYESRQTGDTLVRVQALRSVREFFTGRGLTSLLDVCFSVFFIAFMFYYSVPLALIALTLIPCFFVLNLWAFPHIQRRMTDVWNAGAANQSFLVEVVSNMETVKSLVAEPQFAYRWELLLARYARAVFANVRLHIVLEQGGNMIQGMVSLILLWYGGHMVMRGEFTLGQLIAFQMIFGQATAPFMRLLGSLPYLRQAGMALERIGDVLSVPREPVLVQRRQTLHLQGNISFQNVSFRYRTSKTLVLEDFSLDIRAGERIGIAGRSGSGKSTVAKLLQHLYFPERGSIVLDDVPSERFPLPVLREDIVVVSQDSDLFHRSVRENIALMNPVASMEEIVAAAEAVDAHSFIMDLPDGYDTLVGEQGTTLSGGQGQRIMLARALLARPSILVLDEATSALDYRSERIVLQNLLRLGRNLTIVMIAHRLSALAVCDRVVVMEAGRIVEDDSPENLRSRPGLYHDMWLQKMEG